VSPWFQDRGGFGGRWHPDRCVAVNLYERQYEPVDDRGECPGADPLTDCLLCQLGIGPDRERYAPAAREVADHGDLSALRTIDSKTERRLTEEGYLDENRGAEVVNLSDWKETHRAAINPPLFEFLLQDAIEAHLVFYREHHGHETDEAFLNAALADNHMDCERNVARTYRWLVDDVDAPTERIPLDERFSMQQSHDDRGVDDPGDQAALGGWSA